jgi:hypothetical protein
LKIWAFSLWAACGLAPGLSASTLKLQIFQLDCSHAFAGDILEAVSGAAKILAPCGVSLAAEAPKALKSEPGWCDLPSTEAERAPLLKAMTRPERLKNLHGLSLFILPTGSQARYAFSLIDLAPGAGCGDPRGAEGLADTGSIFITDFGLKGDASFSARLIAHEVAHELTMKRHPTHEAPGSLLADRAADIGGHIPAQDCACMRQSPFVKSP